MNIQFSTAVRLLLNYTNILRDEWLSVVGEVPYGDDIESAVDVGLGQCCGPRLRGSCDDEQKN
jgi:hypothetical protein